MTFFGVAAMRAIWETLHIIVEPSAAVPYAAIMEGKLSAQGRRIGVAGAVELAA